jgi:hypothetical protein
MLGADLDSPKQCRVLARRRQLIVRYPLPCTYESSVLFAVQKLAFCFAGSKSTHAADFPGSA